MFLPFFAFACQQPQPADTTPAVIDTEADTTDSNDSTETGSVEDTAGDTAEGPQRRPIVVLMVGDGMGAAQLEAAGLYATGKAGSLFLEQLPFEGAVTTASLSGVTDSAASATAMATGVVTWNGIVGQDRGLVSVETLVETAQRLGLSAGVVTTAAVSHATPAAFTAHHSNRFDYTTIAQRQVEVLPDVMLGGGRQYFRPATDPESARDDDGLIAPLEAAGCTIVYAAPELAAADPTAPGCLVGLFAEEHLSYVHDRTEGTPEPTLSEMALAALERLDTDEDGFFLMIESARIDMAGHANDLPRMIEEVLAFDAAIEAVASWAADREVLLLVTADHETGGLEVVSGAGAGTLPEVTWQHFVHSNTQIRLFGQGAPAEVLDQQTFHHTWVHSVVRAHLEGTPFTAPASPGPLPDGLLGDLRHTAATQSEAATGTALAALRIDLNDAGLFIGVEGVFSREEDAVALLIDRELGGGSGLAELPGGITDSTGLLEQILRNTAASTTVKDFGADLAVVSVHGELAQLGLLTGNSGTRGLTAEHGWPVDLWWLDSVVTFEERTRFLGSAPAPTAGEGMEVFVPFDVLYPDGGAPPPGAVVGVAAMLLGDEGGLQDQLLPSGPHEAGVLPAIVAFTLDSDGDGSPDGDQAPVVRTE